QWVDSDRAGLRTRRRLTESAREWDQLDRDPDLLFTGARLATAREWSESHPGELTPLEVDFLAAAIVAGRKKKDVEIERARQEVEQSQERAQTQRRIITGLIVGLGVATLLTGFAWWQYDRAKNETTRALRAENNAKVQTQKARAAEEEANKQAKNATA